MFIAALKKSPKINSRKREGLNTLGHCAATSAELQTHLMWDIPVLHCLDLKKRLKTNLDASSVGPNGQAKTAQTRLLGLSFLLLC
jgi:hypothetical protein